jgi:hypothetical protein
MRDLFDQITQEGEPTIDQLVATRTQENVELEFKTKANPSNGDLTKDDRRNLGIILSALSNSMGGLLIWGVKASKNSDDVDCATALDPISQIEKFKNEVERAISQAIMPRHDGIRVFMIPRSSDQASGYLAVHVERSERRPHRSEFGEKQYFKRIGDSSIAMEHYDIEDSFKRLAVPSLDVEYHLSSGGRRSDPEGSFATVRVTLGLKNTSLVSAQYPYLKVESCTGELKGNPRVHRGLQQHPFFFEGGADDVIHPELSVTAVYLDREFRIRQPNYLPCGALRSALIQVRCGCLHSRPTFKTLEITEDEVAAALGLNIVS